MTIKVTNKLARTLEIRTGDGEVYYIPPRVRDLRVVLKSNNILSNSKGLIITKIKD